MDRYCMVGLGGRFSVDWEFGVGLCGVDEIM